MDFNAFWRLVCIFDCNVWFYILNVYLPGLIFKVGILVQFIWFKSPSLTSVKRVT